MSFSAIGTILSHYADIAACHDALRATQPSVRHCPRSPIKAAVPPILLRLLFTFDIYYYCIIYHFLIFALFAMSCRFHTLHDTLSPSFH